MSASRDQSPRRAAYSPAEFAATCGRHPSWSYRLLYCGKVRAITELGRILIPASELDRVLSLAQPYRSASGLKLAHEYTLIRGDCRIGLIYPSFGKAKKIALPTREEYDEESREGTARKEKEILSINDNDIITHAGTGERFNRRTKEFDW